MRLEQRVLAARHPLLGQGDQRAHVAVQLVHGAVVGVQGDVNRVFDGHAAGEVRERDRPGDHFLDGLAGEVLGAAGGDLDDPVAPGVGEPLQRGVQRLA